MQSELVLSCLRLACEILRPGGWYVTKVFRSQDYNNLLWVFNQFFTKATPKNPNPPRPKENLGLCSLSSTLFFSHSLGICLLSSTLAQRRWQVEAHKPSASRNVSAEIFVVCQGYKAPKKIDPKMFDPKAIFGDIANQKPMDVLKGNQKKNRSGYADDAPLGLHKTTSILTFIEAKEPVEHLAMWNAFELDKGDAELLAVVNDHEVAASPNQRHASQTERPKAVNLKPQTSNLKPPGLQGHHRGHQAPLR